MLMEPVNTANTIKTENLKRKGIDWWNHRHGHWEYYEDGKMEGEAEYENGKGTLSWILSDGTLQTKGQWKMKPGGNIGIYERDGKLSGYYKPFYSEKNLGNEEWAGLAKKINR